MAQVNASDGRYSSAVVIVGNIHSSSSMAQVNASDGRNSDGSYTDFGVNLEPHLQQYSRIKDKKTCSSCQTSRWVLFCEDGTSLCNNCDYIASFQRVLCSKCENYRSLSECFQATTNPQTYCCYQCDPEQSIVSCTVCATDRPATDFRGDPLVVKNRPSDDASNVNIASIVDLSLLIIGNSLAIPTHVLLAMLFTGNNAAMFAKNG